MMIKVSEIVKTESLYRVDRKDEDKLKQLLTECFREDPLYCQLIPKQEIRNKILPDIFSCDLDEMFENCEVYADSEDVNGIIVVSDESEPYNPIKYYATEVFYALKTAVYLIKDDPSMQTFINFMKGKSYLNSEWTEEIKQENRLHIIYFAVRPSMRGKGIASKMMSSVLEYADKNRMTTSLETHNVENVHMYEHYGFKLFETVQKNFSLKQFCMVR